MVCSYWFPPDEVRTSAPIGIEDVEGRFGNVRGEETMKCLKRTSDLGSGRRLLRVLCEDMNISIPVRGSGSGNIIAGDKKVQSWLVIWIKRKKRFAICLMNRLVTAQAS
ncbi:unnamed protein product [Rhodiola kirilowii]